MPRGSARSKEQAESRAVLSGSGTRVEVHASQQVSTPSTVDWRKFRSAIRGRVILPDDPSFDAARRVYNGAIDRSPALIVRCAGAADVIAAVAAARARDLPLAIRGGGHSISGFGVCDGGLVVDLSDLRGIHVDTKRLVVTAQAGSTWKDVDHETQAFGLATTGARVSSVGLGGMTLGGGYGWLMRRHGLAIDNLLSADVVTADGQLITASEDDHADLFWALRGGGGNFGVVTSFRFRLHRLDGPITGGTFFYPASRALDLLPCYREMMQAAGDNLSALVALLIAPAVPFLPPDLHNLPVVAITVCHLGTPSDADTDLAPLRRLRPLLDRVALMPYRRLQRLFDAAGVFGRRACSRAGHLAELTDDAMLTWADHAGAIPGTCSIAMLSALGGAVGRVDELQTAFSYRRTAFDFAANAVWSADGDTQRHTAWTSSFARAMRPFVTGCYVNEAAEIGQDGSSAYTPQTYRRLVSLKTAYDPNNVFRLNYNIAPDVEGARAAS
jgi:FAD/FMN-containing dehydrogenase